jgi:hypothetical protein
LAIDIDASDDARGSVRFAAVLTLLLCVAGVAGIWVVGRMQLWRRSMFFEHFAANEGFGIAVLAVGAGVLWAIADRAPRDDTPPFWVSNIGRSPLVLALWAFIAVRVGAAVIFHDYALVDDEYSGLFQATIYSKGLGSALVPQPWCEWIRPLTPLSIAADGCRWQLTYFPVNALIRGGFMALHLSAWAHPVMAALSVWLVMDACRRMWPDQPERAVLAGLFLATSTQFLFTAMSAFSMPAHLLASAAWLWLYARPERWALIALPWLGVVALGVHSPYPHVLFVAPLVLRYLAQRRFTAFAYVALVYVAGSIAWVMWLNGRTHSAAANAAVASAQAIGGTANGTLYHPAGEPVLGALSMVVLGTWNVPIALVCVLAALLLWKRLDSTTRWIAASLVFTLLARAVFFNTYGVGWGHRYAHAALPNFVMVAAAGAGLIAQAIGRARTYRLVAAALIVAVAVQLPVRAVQTARIIRPYERASNYLATLPADVAVIQFESLQWGRQLLRNDPFLRNSPKLMSLSELSSAARDSLEKRFPGRVRYVRPAEIEAFGVKAASRIGRFEIR